MNNDYAERMQGLCVKNDTISEELFKKLGVNRGLRDKNGKGVLTGLTNVSTIISFENRDGERVPVDGRLYYRGHRIEELVGMYDGKGFGFEKTAYLLLFGEMPTDEQADEFIKELAAVRKLPRNFTRDVIMKAPGKDIMNNMTRCILSLAPYDPNTFDANLADNIRQCIKLIAVFPLLAVYSYHASNYYENYESMYIHRPDPRKSTAENILRLIRPDMKYTKTEANVLDMCLMLHMDHGGGNNSTFTTRVVTSAGSDTYAAIAAAMSSLKGPRHGGANLKVMGMMDNIREHVKDPYDKAALEDYLGKILDGKAFDRKGLIYGMGHAVYSLTDPREVVFKQFVTQLAEEKGMQDDLALYNNIEELAPRMIMAKRQVFKEVSPNVDFYSGFVYRMLGIPEELFTPLFAIARIAGWSAHRIEELVGNGKMMRPAYMSVMEVAD